MSDSELLARVALLENRIAAQDAAIAALHVDHNALDQQKAPYAALSKAYNHINTAVANLKNLIDTLTLSVTAQGSDVASITAAWESWSIETQSITQIIDAYFNGNPLEDIYGQITAINGTINGINTQLSGWTTNVQSDLVGSGQGLNYYITQTFAGADFIGAVRSVGVSAGWTNASDVAGMLGGYAQVSYVDTAVAGATEAWATSMTSLTAQVDANYSSVNVRIDAGEMIYAGVVSQNSYDEWDQYLIDNGEIPPGSIGYDEVDGVKSNYQQYVDSVTGWVRTRAAVDAEAIVTFGTAKSLFTDENGHITGWQYFGGSEVESEFIIRTDRFKIVDSDYGAEGKIEALSLQDGVLKVDGYAIGRYLQSWRETYEPRQNKLGDIYERITNSGEPDETREFYLYAGSAWKPFVPDWFKAIIYTLQSDIEALESRVDELDGGGVTFNGTLYENITAELIGIEADLGSLDGDPIYRLVDSGWSGGLGYINGSELTIWDGMYTDVIDREGEQMKITTDKAVVEWSTKTVTIPSTAVVLYDNTTEWAIEVDDARFGG